jgi:hypothetical protein
MFHDAETGAIVGSIEVDDYDLYSSFSQLTFAPDGDDLAFIGIKGALSDILVINTNTLQERIITEEFDTDIMRYRIQWLTSETLNYCINPLVLNGYDFNSESVTYNLETGTAIHIPTCVTDVSPDGRYGILMNFDAEIEVRDLTTGNIVDVLTLTDFSEADSYALTDIIEDEYRWGVGGIIIYAGMPLTVWQPELPCN